MQNPTEPLTRHDGEPLAQPVAGGIASLDPVAADPQELARANRRLALLAGAAAGLLRSADPRQYVRQVYNALAPDLGLDAYFNFLVDSRHNATRLRLDSYDGVPDEVASGFEWLDFGSAVCGVVAEERRERIVEDVQRSTEPVTELIRSLGIAAYASFPLIAGDRLVGTLSFGTRRRPAFQQDDLELLRAIADQVAVAIDRAEGRTAERNARRAAEKASEAMAQFLCTMTHDLRTPLTAVVGLAEVIQGGSAGPVTEQQDRHLERIQTAAWQVVSIIDQILAFSRAEAGGLEVQREDADIAAIAREVVGVLTGEAELKGLEVRANGASDPVVVHTDGGKVGQILTNLVGNAVRYTDAGTVDVAVERSGDGILCRVRDTGRGIAPESHEEIFEPFVRVDAGDEPSNGGSGLGLAVCRRLARLLGGDVEVESSPGQGSVFTLRLPAG